MNKVVCDGMVAVLISPGYGAGWYSWHGIQELLFDPTVVDLVLAERHGEIGPYLDLKYGDDQYFGGIEDLVVLWIPQDTEFKIEEYDGSEHLVFKEDVAWIRA